MKFLVVGSPHAVSTNDVWHGVMKGLRQNGQTVFEYDVCPRFELFQHWEKWLEQTKEKYGVYEPTTFPAPQLLAYEPVLWAALEYEVDVVLYVSPQYLPLSMPAVLRKAGFKVWAWMTEAPYEDAFYALYVAELFDVCFVNDLYSVNYWRICKPNTHYMPHSYDPDVHFPWWDVPEGRRARRNDINDHDHVVYVGSGFQSRLDYLEEVDWNGIDLRLYGNWPLAFAAKEPDEPLAAIKPAVDSRLTPCIKNVALDNAFTARLYRGSAIGFNLHRTERFKGETHIVKGEAYSMGPRAVELAACGCFQVSDFRQEVEDVFGDTLPIYTSPAELGTVIRRYLDDPVRRQDLAVCQYEAIKGRAFQHHVGRALELAA